jgi:hypothetical protein
MPDSDIALAKKRLARDVRIYVIVQIVALCAAVLGWFLTYSHFILNLRWDMIHAFCFILYAAGILVSTAAGFWCCDRLSKAAFLPFKLRVYAFSGSLLFYVFFLVVLLSRELSLLVKILCCIFLLYCILPQFFISRWLAKAAEEESSATEIHG